MSHAAPTPVPQVDAPRRRPSSWLEAKRKPTAKQHLRALRRSQEKRERELDVPQCVAGHQHLFPRSPALGVNSNVNNSLAQSQHIFFPSRILEFLSMMRLSSYLTYVSGGTQEARRIVKLSYRLLFAEDKDRMPVSLEGSSRSLDDTERTVQSVRAFKQRPS